jgi:hypothetical protein
MLQRFRVLQLLVLIILLSSFSISVEAQRRRSRFRQQTTASPAFECRVYCSDEQLRTPVAELSWRSSEARMGETQIEVTVYKDGFKKGLYATLDSSKGSRSFQSQKSRVAQDLIPGLSQLVVVDTSNLADPSNPSNLRVRSGMVAVRIEGLEPGLNYTWRVVSKASGRQVTGVTATCQAPVCPADMQPDEKP